ncbi:acetyl-CoA hydrolase, partial [Ascosphaera pollenicola]
MLRCSSGSAHRTGVVVNTILKQSTNTFLAQNHGQSLVLVRSYQHKPFPERKPVDRVQNTTYSRPTAVPSRRDKRRQREDYRNPKFKLPEFTDRSTVTPKSVILELKWVQDRVALARRVEELLKEDDYDKARELVRAADKNNIDCVVSWNLIFEYLMEHNQSMVAFKQYNDMKKAGTKPNPRTYTIMLSGLANSSSPKAVNLAYSIYRSLSDPRSGVPPSTIHHNALLEVCARHGNLESLWKVIEELPETGPGSPDARTYTIILNAIRANVDKETATMNRWSQMDGILLRRKRALAEAKRIWVVVLNTWRKGRLFIDPHLVISMAKILQFTEEDANCWDVFKLYNQTMGIPLPDQKVNKALEIDAGVVNEHLNSSREDDGFASLFNEVSLEEIRKNAEESIGEKIGLRQAKPTNADLTLLLQTSGTMTNTLGISIGRYYWDLLTDPKGDYKITPDTHAFHEYLRLLRVARNSRESYRAIVEAKEKTPEILCHKTFIIAMSTCERDRKNPNVFMIASKLLEIMEQTQRIPTPKVLMRYAELVELVTSEEQLQARLDFERNKGPDDGEKVKKNKKNEKLITDEKSMFKFTHTEALRILRPHVTRIKQLLAYGKVYTGSIDKRMSLTQIEGEELDSNALNNLEKGQIPKNCKLDVDQAIHSLVAVRRLHITLLNPKWCSLTQDAK